MPPTVEGHGNSLAVDKTSTAAINNLQHICPLLFSSKGKDYVVPHSGPSFHASPSSTGVSGIRKDFVLRKRGKSKQSVTIPAAQTAGSSQWMRSSLCHAAQPGKDTAATGTSAERKRPSQRCVTSREPDPEGRGEGAGMSIPRAGLLHRSHDSFPPRGSPGSLPLLPKKVLSQMPLDTVILPGRV